MILKSLSTSREDSLKLALRHKGSARKYCLVDQQFYLLNRIRSHEKLLFRFPDCSVDICSLKLFVLLNKRAMIL